MNWQEIIVTVVGAIVTALASWLVAWLTKLINTKIQDTKASAFLNSALDVVGSVVKATYQTYVSNIKGTDAWTAETQKQALMLALESARSQLTDEVKAYIEKSGLSVDEWLRQQIEATIYTLKAMSKKENKEDKEESSVDSETSAA